MGISQTGKIKNTRAWWYVETLEVDLRDDRADDYYNDTDQYTMYR